MKIWQFIVLCLLIIIGCGYLGYKIDKNNNESEYQTLQIEGIDKNIKNLKSDIWIIKSDVSLIREGK